MKITPVILFLYCVMAALAVSCACSGCYSESSVDNDSVYGIPLGKAEADSLIKEIAAFDDVNITESPDGKLRFYSWDSGTGGTCISWGNFYQVTEDGETFSYYGFPGNESEILGGYMVNGISLITLSGEVYYLLDCFFKESTSWVIKSILVFRIDGGKLLPAEIFENPDKCCDEHDFTHKISAEYNIWNWCGKTNSMKYYDTGVYVSEQEGTFYEPVGRFCDTDRYVVYRWDGEKARAIRMNAPNPYLNYELQEYVSLLKIMDMGKFIIRIDELEDGRLRYASWKRHDTMSDKPELVLYSEPGDNSDMWSFRNKEYKYEIVNQGAISVLKVYESGKLIYSAEQGGLH